MTTFAWLKGHGTENDFVLLPDHDGTVHGELSGEFVAALCHRRRGLGADGVLRVIRTSAVDLPDVGAAEWFMDYRNADGTISEMCGNGVRVFALHLAQAGLIDPDVPVPIATRDGVKIVAFTDEGTMAVDMGVPTAYAETTIGVDDRTYRAHHVETGNPHAVVFVDDLAQAGPLLDEPVYDSEIYPHGVNVEFVVRRGPQHVAMRVHERGAGETRSCGTGACAAAIATSLADGAEPDIVYRVDVPGGTVNVTWRVDGHVVLAGPAEIIARGWLEWLG